MGLKELRKAKGMSQDELSAASGVNKMQISRVERGDTDIKNMTLINALRIADALGIDPHDLIQGEEQPEMRDIKGYEGLYSVTEDGRVYSHKDRKFFEPKSSSKYLSVTLKNSDGISTIKPIHRIIAETFIPNPDRLPIVHHKDANTRNNSVSNLEWVTQKKNVQECIKRGEFGTMTRRRNIKVKKGVETSEEFVERIRHFMQS